MGMRTYGGFIVHATDELVKKVVPFQFGKLVSTYERYGLTWKHEYSMRSEDYEQELDENISENIGNEHDSDEAYLAILECWKDITRTFKNATGLTLEMCYMNDDTDQWHGGLEEGVNFMINYGEAYLKSPLLLELEEKFKTTIEIELFSMWG